MVPESYNNFLNMYLPDALADREYYKDFFRQNGYADSLDKLASSSGLEPDTDTEDDDIFS